MSIPNYSFKHHQRESHWTTIYGANIIIIEGLYSLYDPRVLELCDLKIFVDTALDICLARRLARDIVYRGRDINLSVLQWERFVKPNFEQFIRHTMYNADIRIPRGIDNTVAIDMLVGNIQRQLQEKSKKHLKYLTSLSDKTDPLHQGNLDSQKSRLNSAQSDISTGSLLSSDNETSALLMDCCEFPENIFVLKQTPQVKAMHTILLDMMSTSREDFVFFFNRISMLLIQRALDEFEYKPKSVPVTTPTNKVYENSIELASIPVAVELIRGGECFEWSLKKTFPTIPIGKVLIQSDSQTGEPHLHSFKLPPIVDPRVEPDGSFHKGDCKAQSQSKILLCDAQLNSGAAATMSVAILMDHGILEENIIVIAYLASEIALRRLHTAFPKVKIIVGMVDLKIYPRYIDNVYFGTA